MLSRWEPWNWDKFKDEKKKRFLLVSEDVYLTDLFIQEVIKSQCCINPKIIQSSEIGKEWLEEQFENQNMLFAEESNIIIKASHKISKEWASIPADFLMITCESIPKDDFGLDVCVVPTINMRESRKFLLYLARIKKIPLNIENAVFWQFFDNFSLIGESAYIYSHLLERFSYENLDIKHSELQKKQKKENNIIADLFWKKKFMLAFEKLSQFEIDDTEGLRMALMEVKYVGINAQRASQLSNWKPSEYIKAIIQIGSWELDARVSGMQAFWSQYKIIATHMKNMCKKASSV